MSDKLTNPHLTKLLKQCEFDSDYVAKGFSVAIEGPCLTNAKLAWATAHKQENARLMPIITALVNEVESLREALEFYSQGGHPAMDMWKHEELGYFTGKRARSTLTNSEERLAKLVEGE